MADLQTHDVPGLDLTAFRTWYDGQRPGELGGELSARVIAGGKSNLTYEVTDGDAWWIVRRPPLGHVQATAHDMGREYTAMTALVDTDVPVPTTYAHCADPDVLGAPFYVMERILGTAYRSAKQLEVLGAERTAAIAGRMVDVLAALHAVDPAAVGLAGFGRPDGFLERQVRRWGKQLEGSKTREHPDADELHRLLTAHVPAEDPAVVGIVHGDYRLDNLLTGDDDQVKAVVDWEMATLGDTRTDVALLLVYDQIAQIAGGDLVADVSRAPGYPDAAGHLARYAQASGHELGDMGFHLGLAYFKLAVILEGIHFRYLQGQTVGEGFDQIGAGFDPLIAAGLDALHQT
jgi:aminoglycoside phosphotransferase (APT) family kinase protein